MADKAIETSVLQAGESDSSLASKKRRRHSVELGNENVETRAEMLERVKASTVTVHVWLKRKVGVYPNSKAEVQGNFIHGSGFFYEGGNGRIMTNAHVVAPAFEGRGEVLFTVVLASGKEVPARVVYVDLARDMAVLEPLVSDEEAVALPPGLSLVDSSTLELGQDVWAVGKPLSGENPTIVSSGTIAALPRKSSGPDDPVSTSERYIHTVAKEFPGMSGGPVVDEQGRVIALVTQLQYDPGKPYVGTFDFETPASEMEVLTEHTDFFIAMQQYALVYQVARGRNELPMHGLEAVCNAVINDFKLLFNAYCISRGFEVHERTMVQARILADDGMQAMLRLAIGGPLSKAERVHFNSKFEEAFGITLYPVDTVASGSETKK